MSATNLQSVTDWYLDLALAADSSIDDPVNDTGLGPQRADLRLSDDFACLLKLTCEGSGESL